MFQSHPVGIGRLPLIVVVGEIVIVLAHLATRLPWITTDYGFDPDAHRVVLAARHLASTGEYQASRLPGYPVHEILTTVTSAWTSPTLSNGLVALFSATSFWLLWRIGRRFQLSSPLLVAVCCSFVPVYYIASVTTIDYVIALTLVLAALLAALRDRPIAAGLALGLAAGARLTSLGFLVPVCIALWTSRSRPAGGTAKAVAVATLATTVTAGICFGPVVWRYGLGFLTYSDPLGYPPLSVVFHRATVEVFGPVGLLALSVIAVILLARPRPVVAALMSSRRRPAVWVSTSSVALTVAAYLVLPHEAAYLVPAIPFLLILLAVVLPDYALMILAGVLLIGNVVRVERTGFDLAGPIVMDYYQRSAMLEEAEAIVNAAKSLPGNAVIVLGPKLPRITVMSEDSRFVYTVTPAEAAGHAVSGHPLFFLESTRLFVQQATGVDFDQHGALPLQIEAE